MYDPLTVAFDIWVPIPKWLQRSNPTSGLTWERYFLLTIWHKDPCSDGTDNSCGWFLPKLNKKEADRAKDLIQNEYDNLKYWFPGLAEHEQIDRIHRIFQIYKRIYRPWYRHPKWHVHHWCFQIHPYQKFRRWAFIRCVGCGGRFKWGESVVGTDRPKGIWHHRCYDNRNRSTH